MLKIHRYLSGRRQEKETLAEYLSRRNRKLPDVLSLISVAHGGSHFFIDSFHASREIGGLKESNLGCPLKNYFGRSIASAHEINQNFITQEKDISDLRYIMLNKPDIEDVYYNFPFARNHIRMILLVRNPISTCLSWKRGWDELLKRDYGRSDLKTNDVFAYTASLQMSQILRFLDGHREDRDFIVSIENFTMNTLPTMKYFSSRLDITEWDIDRKSNATDLTAGGYKHDRKVGKDELASWKKKEETSELYEVATSIFGENFMRYYEEEAYLGEDSRKTFADICLGLRGRTAPQRDALNLNSF